MVPNEHWGCAAVPPGLIAYARIVRGICDSDRGICDDTARAYNAFSHVYLIKKHILFLVKISMYNSLTRTCLALYVPVVTSCRDKNN